METLTKDPQEELEAAEIARRFEEATDAEVGTDADVEVAEEAMEDLASEAGGSTATEEPVEEKDDLRERFGKYTGDEWQMQYVDFLNRENPGDFPTMRFDVSAIDLRKYMLC